MAIELSLPTQKGAKNGDWLRAQATKHPLQNVACGAYPRFSRCCPRFSRWSVSRAGPAKVGQAQGAANIGSSMDHLNAAF